jgi:hypothetical protein
MPDPFSVEDEEASEDDEAGTEPEKVEPKEQ